MFEAIVLELATLALLAAKIRITLDRLSPSPLRSRNSRTVVTPPHLGQLNDRLQASSDRQYELLS